MRQYYKNKSHYQKYQRKSHLKNKWGLSLDDFDKILRKQNLRCAICRSLQNTFRENFMIDHNHNTNQIRGLLCRRCNLLLGYAKDNPKILNLAEKYLTKWKEK